MFSAFVREERVEGLRLSTFAAPFSPETFHSAVGDRRMTAFHLEIDPRSIEAEQGFDLVVPRPRHGRLCVRNFDIGSPGSR